MKDMREQSPDSIRFDGTARRGGRSNAAVRQAGALILASVTLWTVSAASGSGNALSAIKSVKESISLAVSHGIFSNFPEDSELSPAAVIILRQSPTLYAARLSVPAARPEEEWEDMPDGAVSESEYDPGMAENPVDNMESGPEATQDTTAQDTQIGEESARSTDENIIQPSETPIQPIASVDNGVRARTLIPTGSGGYTVIGNVYISSTRKDDLSVAALREPFDAELTGEAPQILILHSHGSEAYTPVPGTEVVWSGDSRTTDFRYSVVRAGDEMASIFADAGISVIHDRTLYDYPDYSGSYDRSLAAIQSYLAQYPSIRFVLDVHRDYISDSRGNPYKVVSEIDGLGTAAQMTLVMGSDGSGAAHPNWMENLKLAVAIQEQILTDYPTLMRPILLRKSRYNQHATTGSLLVEVGTAGNAPEEAFLSARLFALEMVKVLIARSK